MLRRLSAGYFGGSVGGIVSGFAIWIAAKADLLERLAVNIRPDLTWEWLSVRILWGGPNEESYAFRPI